MVNEHTSLVSWDAPLAYQKIEHSDWLCPGIDMNVLETLRQVTGEVKESDIEMLTNERQQHLEIAELPEGYHGIRIVDTQSGEVVTALGSENKHISLTMDTIDETELVAIAEPIIDQNNPLDLGHGRSLYGIVAKGNGVEAVIRPTPVERTEPDHNARRGSGMYLNMDAQTLSVRGIGNSRIVSQACANFSIFEEEAVSQADLFISVRGTGHTAKGGLRVNIAEDGSVQKLRLHKDEWLRLLNVDADLDFSSSNHWANVVDTGLQTKIMDGVTRIFEVGTTWTGLDLRLSASGIYAAMGRRGFDPMTAVVLND